MATKAAADTFALVSSMTSASSSDQFSGTFNYDTPYYHHSPPDKSITKMFVYFSGAGFIAKGVGEGSWVKYHPLAMARTLNETIYIIDCNTDDKKEQKKVMLMWILDPSDRTSKADCWHNHRLWEPVLRSNKRPAGSIFIGLERGQARLTGMRSIECLAPGSVMNFSWRAPTALTSLWSTSARILLRKAIPTSSCLRSFSPPSTLKISISQSVYGATTESKISPSSGHADWTGKRIWRRSVWA